MMMRYLSKAIESSRRLDRTILYLTLTSFATGVQVLTTLPALAVNTSYNSMGDCGWLGGRPFVKGWIDWSGASATSNAKVVATLLNDNGRGFVVVAVNNPSQATRGDRGRAESEAAQPSGKGWFRGRTEHYASFYSSSPKTLTLQDFQCR